MLLRCCVATFVQAIVLVRVTALVACGGRGGGDDTQRAPSAAASLNGEAAPGSPSRYSTASGVAARNDGSGTSEGRGAADPSATSVGGSSVLSPAATAAGTGFATRPFLFQADRVRLLASVAAKEPEATGSRSNDPGKPLGFINMCKSVFATRQKGKTPENSDVDTWHFALAGWLVNDTAMMDMARDEALAVVGANPGGISGTGDGFQHTESAILNVAGVADLAYSRFDAGQLAQVATWVNGTLANWNKQNLAYWPFDEPRNNYWQNGFLAFSVAGIATEGFNRQAAEWRKLTETMAGKLRTAASAPAWKGPLQSEGRYYSAYVGSAIWAMQLYDQVMGTNLLGESGVSPVEQLNLVMFETKPSLLEFFEVGSEPATSTAPFHPTTLWYWHLLIRMAPGSAQAQHAKSILALAMADGRNLWPRSSKGFSNFFWSIRGVTAAPLAGKSERMYVAPTPGAGLIGVRSSLGFVPGGRAALMFANYFDFSPAFSHGNPDAPGFQWASGDDWLVTDPEYYHSGSGILAEAGSPHLSDISNIVTLAGQKWSDSGKYPVINFAEDNRAESVSHFYAQINAQPYWNTATVYRRDYVWLDDLRVVVVFDHIVSKAAKTWRLHVPGPVSIADNIARYSIGSETVTVRDLHSSSNAALTQQNLNGSVTTQDVWRIAQNDPAIDYRSLKVLDVGARVSSAELTRASGSFTVEIEIGGATAVHVTFKDDGSHALVKRAP